MNAIGYGVNLLDKEKCCGVAKIANNLVDAARRDANINLESIRKSVAKGAGSAYNQLDARHHARRISTIYSDIDTHDVRDHIQPRHRHCIQPSSTSGKVKVAFRPDFKRRVAYHTHAIRKTSRWAIYSTSLLKMIPGLEFVPLESVCCGIAGTYGFKKENYNYSQQIGNALFEQITPCRSRQRSHRLRDRKWQIEMSTGVHVDNPISIFAEVLDIEATRRLNGL